MTVKQLREVVELLANEPEDLKVLVWLPGSIIDLGATIMNFKDARGILIEGNVRKGSALDQ